MVRWSVNVEIIAIRMRMHNCEMRCECGITSPCKVQCEVHTSSNTTTRVRRDDDPQTGIYEVSPTTRACRRTYQLAVEGVVESLMRNCVVESLVKNCVREWNGSAVRRRAHRSHHHPNCY